MDAFELSLCADVNWALSVQRSEAGPEVRLSQPSSPSGQAGAEQGTAAPQASPLTQLYDAEECDRCGGLASHLGTGDNSWHISAPVVYTPHCLQHATTKEFA